jgi:hypothetical protein
VSALTLINEVFDMYWFNAAPRALKEHNDDRISARESMFRARERLSDHESTV